MHIMNRFILLLVSACLLISVLSQRAMAATTLPFTVTMSEAVNVTGFPRIELNVDGNTRYAVYSAGTGTASLTFTYAATAGDLDLNGIAISSTAVDLDGGTITDLNGNAISNLTFTAPSTASVNVDYPSMSMDFIVDTDGRFTLGGTVYNSVTAFLTAAGGGFSRPTTGYYYDSTGTLTAAAAGVARFDHNPITLAPRGIMIEEARTNFTKNNTFSGITGGTYTTNQNFTNWTLGIPADLTAESVTITPGTSNGIPYLDLRMQGVNATGGTRYITFNPPTVADGMAVTNGTQTMASAWFGVISYTAAGGTCTSVLQNRSMTSAAAYITGNDLGLTAVATYQPRNTNIITHGATAAYAAPWFYLAIPNGVTCDVTFRIGAPQIEQGTTPTSPIPTGANATAARSGDLFFIPGGTWYNASEGMLYAQALNGSKSSTVGLAVLEDTANTGNERITLIRTGGASIEAMVRNAAAVQFQQSMAANGNGLLNETAVAFEPNNFRASTNGTMTVLDTSGVLPAGINQLRIGTWGGNTAPVIFNGWIQKVKYYPLRNSDTQLQLMTQ